MCEIIIIIIATRLRLTQTIQGGCVRQHMRAPGSNTRRRTRARGFETNNGRAQDQLTLGSMTRNRFFAARVRKRHSQPASHIALCINIQHHLHYQTFRHVRNIFTENNVYYGNQQRARPRPTHARLLRSVTGILRKK